MNSALGRKKSQVLQDIKKDKVDDFAKFVLSSKQPVKSANKHLDESIDSVENLGKQISVSLKSAVRKTGDKTTIGVDNFLDDDGGIGTTDADTWKVNVKPITATINFDPNTLNLSSNEKWVTVYIELPEGYDVRQIDATTVRLNGIVPAITDEKYGWVKSEDSYITDEDKDGILERMVKFDKTAVAAILQVGDEVEVTVTGGVNFDNGHAIGLADFEGKDQIRVIDKGKGDEVAQDKGKGKDKGKAAPAFVKYFFSALPAYPQPSNPEVWIPYSLAEDVQVVITIYNAAGRLVRRLDIGHQRTGIYASKVRAAHWDGKNNAGEKVATGIYFYAIKAGSFNATRKILIAK